MNKKEIHELRGATAYDSNQEELGSVKEVYINDRTGQPDFVEISHSLFGRSSSVVPLRGHHLKGEELRLGFTKDHIRDSPEIGAVDHLSAEQLYTLHHHYELEHGKNFENYASEARETGRFDHIAPPARPNDRMGATELGDTYGQAAATSADAERDRESDSTSGLQPQTDEERAEQGHADATHTATTRKGTTRADQSEITAEDPEEDRPLDSPLTEKLKPGSASAADPDRRL